MTSDSLKRRVLAVALAGGGCVFILILLSMAAWPLPHRASLLAHLGVALGLAGLSAVLIRLAAEQALAPYAQAARDARDRLEQAAAGDIASPLPEAIGTVWPDLAETMAVMFARMRRNLDRMNRLAFYDSVSGLPNRTHFRDAAARLEEKSGADRQLALLFVDLDRFKTVNDRLGHAAGDQLLREIGQRLKTVAQSWPDTLVARLAGDEFTILLPDADRAEAMAVGQAVVEAVGLPVAIDEHRICIGASVGIAIGPDHGRGLPALMRAADIAMYHAKAEGRGCVKLFAPTLIDTRHGRMSCAMSAAGPGRTQIVSLDDLASGERLGVQALWREDSGRCTAALPDAALVEMLSAAPPGDLPITVGLDSRQLIEPVLLDRLRETAQRRALTVLVDGAVLGRDGGAMVATLRDAGATLAIAGYGASGITIDLLRALRPMALHFAPGLTGPIAESADARNLVSALVALGHAVGALAVAEGGDAALLKALGCDLMRGEAIGFDQMSVRRISAA